MTTLYVATGPQIAVTGERMNPGARTDVFQSRFTPVG